MSSIVKTIVTTGASSGLGFEAVKQLLQQAQPYKFIIGARDTKQTQAAYNELKFDGSKHSISILPLELSDLRNVKSFAQQTLVKLGHDKLDILFLNAGIVKDASGPDPTVHSGAILTWSITCHYLTHLLREKLSASQSRIVVVSSGAVRRVRDNDPKTLDGDLKAGAGTDGMMAYSASKFIQLLGAHYWRRQLQGSATVVAVTPGPIPITGIQRHLVTRLTMDLPGARTIPEGAKSLLNAFTKDDFPADPEQIFLTSSGEWWPKEVYALSLDKDLQDKWCLRKEEIEKEAGISGQDNVEVK